MYVEYKQIWNAALTMIYGFPTFCRYFEGMWCVRRCHVARSVYKSLKYKCIRDVRHRTFAADQMWAMTDPSVPSHSTRTVRGLSLSILKNVYVSDLLANMIQKIGIEWMAESNFHTQKSEIMKNGCLHQRKQIVWKWFTGTQCIERCRNDNVTNHAARLPYCDGIDKNPKNAQHQTHEQWTIFQYESIFSHLEVNSPCNCIDPTISCIMLMPSISFSVIFSV